MKGFMYDREFEAMKGAIEYRDAKMNYVIANCKGDAKQTFQKNILHAKQLIGSCEKAAADYGAKAWTFFYTAQTMFALGETLGELERKVNELPPGYPYSVMPPVRLKDEQPDIDVWSHYGIGEWE